MRLTPNPKPQTPNNKQRNKVFHAPHNYASQNLPLRNPAFPQGAPHD